MHPIQLIFEVERIVIQGYAQPTKIGLSDIDIARAKAVKKLLIKDGLDYPIVVEGMGQAESKKGDLSRLAVVTVEGKHKQLYNTLKISGLNKVFSKFKQSGSYPKNLV